MNGLEYYVQVLLQMVSQTNDRLARVELELQRNNDLVAALLKVQGVTVNLAQGDINRVDVQGGTVGQASAGTGSHQKSD